MSLVARPDIATRSPDPRQPLIIWLRIGDLTRANSAIGGFVGNTGWGLFGNQTNNP
jgi:hypothetical protein